ncbi:hypothetical protein NE237_010472 [Protea cynaroides]|uniref:Uncharacterized protein n=1 Tax=Protea cynaroides TaxID=273540 RepID=A0A9Q0R1M5_9MAGN|nr:hypothetical protein NE237_010472 [Protea cynaroides]
MADPHINRKRDHALRLDPDGSALEKFSFCGVSVAISLANMHDCKAKPENKRLKGANRNQNPEILIVEGKPRSPFGLFMWMMGQILWVMKSLIWTVDSKRTGTAMGVLRAFFSISFERFDSSEWNKMMSIYVFLDKFSMETKKEAWKYEVF